MSRCQLKLQNPLAAYVSQESPQCNRIFLGRYESSGKPPNRENGDKPLNKGGGVRIERYQKRVGLRCNKDRGNLGASSESGRGWDTWNRRRKVEGDKKAEAWAAEMRLCLRAEIPMGSVATRVEEGMRAREERERAGSVCVSEEVESAGKGKQRPN
ncbi:hypothetical protein DFH09DRAFT_1087459 [Mycena vulgaris]|nr:hypothetical protein DFH09DRAFT_1087459 [Mycena vulgaris]